MEDYAIVATARVLENALHVYGQVTGTNYNANNIPIDYERFIDPIKNYLNDPCSLGVQHQRWLEAKEAEGWSYGAKIDQENKLHPCMVPYEKLSEAQKRKDLLFQYIVQAMITDIP